MLEEPYFMKDERWFYFDEKNFMYKLTENAPEKARKSYEEFYKTGDGDTVIHR